MKEQYYKFRDRSALIMLLGPGLLAVGMARAEAVRGQSLSADLSYAPGLMTGTQKSFDYFRHVVKCGRDMDGKYVYGCMTDSVYMERTLVEMISLP